MSHLQKLKEWSSVQRAQRQLSKPLKPAGQLGAGNLIHIRGAREKIEEALSADEFQFPRSEQREQAVQDARAILAKKHKAKGYYDRWSWSEDLTELNDVFDQYVRSAPDVIAPRTQSVKDSVSRFLSEEHFDELAILAVLRGDAADLPPERKQEITRYILDNSRLTFSTPALRTINDFGYGAAKNDLLESITEFVKTLPIRNDYPYNELETLYGDVRATFYDCIPEIQDEIIQAVAEFEQVLNSEGTLTKWGGSAENKVQGAITLLNELKSARAEPKPEVEGSVEPKSPETSPDPWATNNDR